METGAKPVNYSSHWSLFGDVQKCMFYDVINTVEARLLYGKMSDEAQIPVANVPNVPHVVFSIVGPNYGECP